MWQTGGIIRYTPYRFSCVDFWIFSNRFLHVFQIDFWMFFRTLLNTFSSLFTFYIVVRCSRLLMAGPMIRVLVCGSNGSEQTIWNATSFVKVRRDDGLWGMNWIASRVLSEQTSVITSVGRCLKTLSAEYCSEIPGYGSRMFIWGGHERVEKIFWQEATAKIGANVKMHIPIQKSGVGLIMLEAAWEITWILRVVKYKREIKLFIGKWLNGWGEVCLDRALLEGAF